MAETGVAAPGVNVGCGIAAIRRGAAVVSVVVVWACAPHGGSLTPARSFAQHVDDYLVLRNEAVRRAGQLAVTADARALQAEIDDLAQMIQRLRAGQRQGVFFSPAVAAGVRRNLAVSFTGVDRTDLIRAVAEVQPSRFVPRVNERYPDGEPRASSPPSVFAALPAIPAVLAYRFSGRSLLLLDRDTGVILDILPAALPPAAAGPSSTRPQ
jgi:hypothetical protein